MFQVFVIFVEEAYTNTLMHRMIRTSLFHRTYYDVFDKAASTFADG